MAEAAREAVHIATATDLRALAPASRHVLRGEERVIATAAQVLGLTPTIEACRATTDGQCSMLWLGPDEQLLLAPESEHATLTERLAAALEPLPHSLVDVSHRQTAVEVTGEHAEEMLAIGCALDLSDAAFPVGMCTRTMLAKAEIVLWRTAAGRFHVEVWRSFAAYVTGVLALASEQLTAPK